MFEMKARRAVAVTAVGVVCLAAFGRAQSPLAGKPNFSGDWTLNRELSEGLHPHGPETQPSTDPRRGGRFGGGIGGPGGFGGMGRGRYGGGPPQTENADARVKMQELVNDARRPSPSLEISHSAVNIAVTDVRGRTRFYQTNGSRDKHQLDSGTIDSTTRWAGDQLVTEYDLGNGRRMICTYSLITNPKRLLVRIRFDGPGAIAPMTYVYEPARRR
jgi:hypothetical protein